MKICQMCLLIQSDILNVYYSLAHLFCSFHLSFPTLHQLRDCLSWNRIQFPCDFLFLMWLLLQILHLIICLLFSGCLFTFNRTSSSSSTSSSSPSSYVSSQWSIDPASLTMGYHLHWSLAISSVSSGWPDKILFVRLIKPYRNFRQLH